jgi:hypothetical protein
MDFREIGCGVTDWIDLVQNEDQWQALVMNEYSGSVKAGKCMSS